MSGIRPIHLPGSSALARLAQRTRTALAAWARDWVMDEQVVAALTIENADVGEPGSPPDFECLQGAQGCIWIRRGSPDRAAFGHAVVGSVLMPRHSHADAWIADIADEAWSLRNRALCEALVGAPSAVQPADAGVWPADLTKRDSGAVQVCCEPLGLHAIADGGVWTRLPPPERQAERQPALVSLERAARRSHLRIDVMLGGAELELPRLLDLRRGDVLRLSTRIDQPLTVSCEGRPFARALLGDAAGRKSIQLTDKYQ